MDPSNFSSFLKRISKTTHPVLDANIPKLQYIPLDLSISNQELQRVDVSSSDDLERYINYYIEKNNASVAYGGYNEIRNIYRRSTYFNQSNLDTERNIHIGLDLWLAAGSQIYTPLDATVHSFKNNTNHGDYGPTIILKHQIEGVEFHTLCGHLSLSSIANLKEGQLFKRGEPLAFLGDASVNGDYPPHLHFQIIRDMQDFRGDYPGVCSKKDLQFYLENCPDPEVLLKLV